LLLEDLVGVDPRTVVVEKLEVADPHAPRLPAEAGRARGRPNEAVAHALGLCKGAVV
jgi:hypothetical protein